MKNQDINLAIAKTRYAIVEMRWCNIQTECSQAEEIQSMYDVRDSISDWFWTDAKLQQNIQTGHYIQLPCWQESGQAEDGILWERWRTCPDWANDLRALAELITDMQTACSLLHIDHYHNYPGDLIDSWNVWGVSSVNHQVIIDGKDEGFNMAVCLAYLNWKGINLDNRSVP